MAGYVLVPSLPGGVLRVRTAMASGAPMGSIRKSGRPHRVRPGVPPLSKEAPKRCHGHLAMAAFAQLLLVRPLAADLRRPWETRPPDNRPLSPGRVRGGFANIRAQLGTPAHVAKPARPGPGRPKGTPKRPAPRYPVPKKTSTTDKQSTQNRRSKVKT